MSKHVLYTPKGQKTLLDYGMSRVLPVEVLVPMKCKIIYSNKKDAQHDADYWERNGHLTKIVSGKFPDREYELWISVYKWGVK